MNLGTASVDQKKEHQFPQCFRSIVRIEVLLVDLVSVTEHPIVKAQFASFTRTLWYHSILPYTQRTRKNKPTHNSRPIPLPKERKKEAKDATIHPFLIKSRVSWSDACIAVVAVVMAAWTWKIW